MQWPGPPPVMISFVLLLPFSVDFVGLLILHLPFLASSAPRLRGDLADWEVKKRVYGEQSARVELRPWCGTIGSFVMPLPNRSQNALPCY